MTWLPVILLAASMAVVGVGTTYFWLRLLRVPSYVVPVLAPAVTVVVVIVMGIIYARLGFFWSGARVIPVLLAFGALGFVLFYRFGKRSVSNPMGRWFWVVLAAGWLLAALPMMLSAPSYNPIQQWDPSFHMNGVWSINNTGIGSWSQALAPNYGGKAEPEYPAAWHIYTSLFSTATTVVQASNASSLALMLLWIAGASVYTRVLFRSKIAWTLAPLVAAGMMGMPADGLGAYTQWPNASSVALLPGVASFAVLLGRGFYKAWTSDDRKWTGQHSLASIAVLIVASIGLVAAHPSGAFAATFMLAPAAIAGLTGLWVSDLNTRRAYGLILWPLIGIGVLTSVWFALSTPEVRSMGNYPRSGISWKLAFSKFLTPSPPFGNSLSLSLWTVVIAILMLAGATTIIATRLHWTRKTKFLPLWPIFSFLVFAGLVLLAYGPNSPIRTFFAAPWYLDARRIMQPQNLTMVPLAALGFGAGIRYLQKGVARANTVVAAVCILVFLFVSGFGGFNARLGAFQSVYDGNKLGKPGMATEAELEMLRGLDELLPADAVILGDPQNGAVYAEAIGNRRAVFPQLTYWSGMGEARKYLKDHFKDIQTDPKVCQAVREIGVTHFYEDADGMYYNKRRSDRSPGLYGVDTSSGFEKVAQGGEASLYRITACDGS